MSTKGVVGPYEREVSPITPPPVTVTYIQVSTKLRQLLGSRCGDAGGGNRRGEEEGGGGCWGAGRGGGNREGRGGRLEYGVGGQVGGGGQYEWGGAG